MNPVCIKCESIAELSDNGYCGGCFDYQDELELHIAKAFDALKVVQFEHDVFKRDVARVEYGRKFDALLAFSDWSIEKAVKVLWDRLGEQA